MLPTMSARMSPWLGRAAFGLTAAAVLWSAALVVAAFTVPFYSGARVEPDGTTTRTSETLVGANGLYAAGLVAFVLLVAATVWWALHRTCTRPGSRARSLAWALTSLLLFFCLLTGFTIGPFVVPAALALVGACLLTPRPAAT
jgi:hypothetical protein